MTRSMSLRLFGALVVPFAACGTDTAVDVASEAAALTAAQCDSQASNVAVDACFAAFRTCKGADGAVEADCRATLDTCLPAGIPRRPPRGKHGDGGCSGGAGGERGRGGDGPLGGLLGGRPDDADGGRPGGPRGSGGAGGERGGPRGPVGPDDTSVQACQTTAQSCVAAGTDESTCRDAARTCVHDAFAAAFEARCAELTTACTANAGQDCSELTQRCAEGLPQGPPAASCTAQVTEP
jgi:hypothetical protein